MRSFFVPFGFMPGMIFSTIKSGIISTSESGKAFTSVKLLITKQVRIK
jgi:hypothetical protein